MRRINDNHVNAGFYEKLEALFGAGSDADGSARKELAVLIFGGVGVFGGFDDVLDGDKAREVEVLVHDENTFETVFVHQALGFIKRCPFLHGDQTFARRHDFTHRSLHAGFKAKVAVGDHAQNAAAFHNGHTADAVFKAHADHVADEHIRAHGDGVAHNAGFMALNLGDFRGLLFGGKILVNNANTAFLRHRNGEIGFGHRIHGGRNHRDVDADFTGEFGGEENVLGKNFRVCRNEQDVIEGKSLLKEPHFFTSNAKINYIAPVRRLSNPPRNCG